MQIYEIFCVSFENFNLAAVATLRSSATILFIAYSSNILFFILPHLLYQLKISLLL
jgi:hypothetical protein